MKFLCKDSIYSENTFYPPNSRPCVNVLKFTLILFWGKSNVKYLDFAPHFHELWEVLSKYGKYREQNISYWKYAKYDRMLSSYTFLRSAFMIAPSKWKYSSKLYFSSSPSLLNYMYNMFWMEACFIAWNHSRLLAKPLSWQQGLWISIEKYTLTLTEISKQYFLDKFCDVLEEIWFCKLAKYETPPWKIWYPSLFSFVIILLS